MTSIGKAALDNAFAAVYDENVERMFRYHYYRTRHRETAEDLTSQTFLKALEHFERFDPAKASASTWLYRIAQNTLIDHFRVTRPSDDIDEFAEVLRSTHDVERDVGTRQALERVHAILSRLTPQQRSIVLLRLWDGLSYAEIADLTGKSESACKMTFMRAVSAIRKQAGPVAFATILLITSF